MLNGRLCSNHYFFWRRQEIRFTDDTDSALEITAFSDGKSTQQFLSQFRNNYYAMCGLRALLSESRQWIDASRFTADQVLAEVSRLILAGDLGVALRPYEYYLGTSSTQLSGAPPPLPASSPLAASKFEESEPPTFPNDLNGVIQAAALSAAAASGAPFCPH